MASSDDEPTETSTPTCDVGVTRDPHEWAAYEPDRTAPPLSETGVRHVEQWPEEDPYAVTSKRDGRVDEWFPTERDDCPVRIRAG